MRLVLASILTGALLLYACSSSDSSPATPPATTTDGGSDNTGIPDPSALFDALPAATPGKLRGVWETKPADPNGTIEVRLRFTDDYIAVAVRCTAMGQTPIVLPDLEGYAIDNADTPSGSFEYGGISIAGEDDAGFKCGAQLPDGVLVYAVTGTMLKLTKQGEQGEIDFTKVGD